MIYKFNIPRLSDRSEKKYFYLEIKTGSEISPENSMNKFMYAISEQKESHKKITQSRMATHFKTQGFIVNKIKVIELNL